MTKTRPEDKDTQRMSDALQRFYDAQMAVQHDAFEATRMGLLGAVALQRAGLQAVERAVDAASDGMKPAENAIRDGTRAWIAAVPGVTPEAADRFADDTAASMRNVETVMTRAGTTMRDATRQATARYEDTLRTMEERGTESVRVMEETAQKGVILANRVTGAWMDAMTDAARATTSAVEEAQSAIVETAERTPSSGSKSGGKKT